MSEACNHDCSSCKSNCDHRAPQHEPPHARSRIQKVIGVVSGKGGVGKSMTSAMLAVSMRRLGFKAGVLDADITGPSIPRLFGVKGPATGDGESLNPVSSRTGVEIMSINLLLDDPEAPVVWRGPVIAGAVKQFWQEVVWDVDFLFVDMPPGTGDVPLTVFQTLPVDGIVIVSSPQELVGMIVGKAVQMAQMMHVPILGLVENMSYAVCPDCGKHINVFGDSHVDEIADKYKLPVLAKMPIDPELAKEADAGMIEMFAGDYLDNAAQTVAKLLKKFFEEFKAFALKGNMMDMAIGVIIGGAFSTLVTSLTDNLISPILGILGKVNFDAMMWDVFGDGKLVFKYGAFITAVINFLIMAFVLFCIVKAMNKLMEMGKHEEPAAEPAAPAAPTQEELLAEILVELKKQNGEKTA